MGDPTAQLARLPRASPEEIVKLRAYYGLDKSLLGQFGDYAKDTVKLDFGISQRSRRNVSTELGEAIPWTLLLVGTGTLLATLLGTWLGVIAATRRGTASDDGLLGFSLFTYAAPEYWIGIILICCSRSWLPLFPAGQQVTPGADFSFRLAKAADVAEHMVLPVGSAHADAARPVLRDHALPRGRRPHRGLRDRQAGDGDAVESGRAQARRAERAAPARDAGRRCSSATVAGGVITIETIFSSAGAGRAPPTTRSTTRTSRSCRAPSSSSRSR